MFISFKTMCVAICGVALVFFRMEIHPATGNDVRRRIGRLFPIPKRLAVAYPKLAVYLFVLGAPMLFVALLITHLAVTLISLVVLSAMAFHEKAGRSQEDSCLFLLATVFFLLPSRHYCRHPSIRTLGERRALGASWAFSFTAGAAT